MKVMNSDGSSSDVGERAQKTKSGIWKIKLKKFDSMNLKDFFNYKQLFKPEALLSNFNSKIYTKYCLYFVLWHSIKTLFYESFHFLLS